MLVGASYRQNARRDSTPGARATVHGPGITATGPTVRGPLITCRVFVTLATVRDRITNNQGPATWAQLTYQGAQLTYQGAAHGPPLKAHGPRPGAGSRVQAAQLRELGPPARAPPGRAAHATRATAHGPRYGPQRARDHGPRAP